MKTLNLKEPGRWLASETPEPAAPGPGKALIRIHHIGVCGTDIHAYRGEQPFFDYPRILGHELGVEVLDVGDGVTNVGPGDRCAVEPYVTCGDCPPCRRGKTNCCESLKCLGVQTDGGMRERIVVPAHKLHPSKELSFEALALVETLGIGRHAVDRSGVGPGDRAAVLGLGPIGLTVATFAKLAGADVVGIDVSETRAQAARQLIGIDTLVIETERPIAEQWSSSFGDAPPYVFEATGSRASMLNAFALPGHGGTFVLVGLVLGELSFDDPSFHRRELTLLSSRNATGADFRAIIGLIEEGKIDPASWITHRCELHDLPGVLDVWLRPDAGLLKGVLSIE
jgi:2-desacetyl-2-hydroxyethyl bacteriochlorophyllide A dehydrogenase